MKVFISFSSSDQKIAEKIYARLVKNGLDCWISTKNIPPGADYQACIVDAINASDVVVLVFSSQANASAEIAKELSLASKKILIPARIEDVIPQGSFQYQLSNRQFVDLFEDFDNKLDELSDRIKHVVDGSHTINTSTTRSRSRNNKNIVKILSAMTLIACVAGLGWFFLNKPTTNSQTAQVIPTPSIASSSPIPPKQSIATTEPENQTSLAKGQESKIAVQLSKNDVPTVSEKIKVLLTLLDGTHNFDRLNAINSINDKLPNNINSTEANAILNGTGSQRSAGISAISERLASNLGGADISTILGDTSDFDRLNAIQYLARAGKIKNGLNQDDLAKVLQNTNSQKTNAISVLASYMTK